MKHKTHPPRGFTMFELLAVFAVIALLITLLIPAIQQAREAARRMKCHSNLHQLGVALHGYHETYNQFPPVYVAVRNATQSVLPRFIGVEGPKDDLNVHTYGEMLLPYLDQGALFERINFSQPSFAPVDLTSHGLPNYTADNQSVVATPISIFLCPSAPRIDNPHEYTWEAREEAPFPLTYRVGGNDYGPSNGVGHVLLEFAPEQGDESQGVHSRPRGEGILSNNNPSASLALVTDGTSQTSLMWEIAGRPQLWRNGAKVDGIVTGGGGWADLLNAENWFAGTSEDGAALDGPCVINCTNRYEAGTYSFHPGGVHVLLCDGSARFMSENTSAGVFVQIVTYHGNTPAGEF